MCLAKPRMNTFSKYLEEIFSLMFWSMTVQTHITLRHVDWNFLNDFSFWFFNIPFRFLIFEENTLLPFFLLSFLPFFLSSIIHQTFICPGIYHISSILLNAVVLAIWERLHFRCDCLIFLTFRTLYQIHGHIWKVCLLYYFDLYQNPFRNILKSNLLQVFSHHPHRLYLIK